MLYSARLKERVARENSAVIVAMARLMAETFDGGGRVLFCGNGAVQLMRSILQPN